MHKLLPLLLIILSACSPLVTTTPRPSPQAITVSYTATLRPWVEILNQCAIDHPDIALIIRETSLSDPEFQEADIALWFGELPQDFSGYAASLGTDEIIVIAGEGVNIQDLTQAQLIEIYTDPDSLYHVWTYGDENELRQIFDLVVLGTTALSPESLLSPNPATMLEAIQKDPLAIGYFPKSWLTMGVNTLMIKPELQETFKQPVLALTKAKPIGPLQSYMVCIQDHAP